MSPELIAILGTIVGIGIALTALILRATARLEARLDGFVAEAGNDRRAFQAAMDDDRRAFQAAMDDDRRAFQAAMDDFRREMRHLAERQAHVEGLRAAE